MTASLEEAKKILKGRYVGQSGIHGIGLSRSQNTVILYVSPGQSNRPEFKSLLKKITLEISPFKVIGKEEDKPRL